MHYDSNAVAGDVVSGNVVYSARDLERLSGVSYRQIDYWCRNGLFGDSVRGTGSGSRRRFPPEDLRACRAIKRVMDVLEKLLGEARAPGTVVLYGKVAEQARLGCVEVCLDLTAYGRLIVSLEGI